MPKLYRPSIPLEVKCRVALRQLGEMWIDRVIEEHRADFTVSPTYRRTHGKLLSSLLPRLAELLGCVAADLRLDHNPALALRTRHGRGKTTIYIPPANDPEHLIYRSHADHHIKTNVRGDGAQFSDTTLMKRERRRAKKKAAPVKSKRRNDKRNRKFVKRSNWAKGRKLPTKKDRKWKR